MSKRNKQTSFLPMDKFGISVVIPVYNLFDIFQKCLDAIPAAFGDIPYEVIIVDNGSDEKIATQFYDDARGDHHIHVYKMHKNTGFPYACNFGATKSSFPVLLFLNSDVILTPDSIKYPLEDIKDPINGVVGLKLLFPLDSSDPSRPSGKIQHVGLSSDITGQIMHQFIGWSSDNPRVNKMRNVLGVTGAFFMLTRANFRKLNGFDMIYGMGCFEEIDLCIRARMMGLEVVVNTQTFAYHYAGASVGAGGQGFNLQRNQSIFMARYEGNYGWTAMVNY